MTPAPVVLQSRVERITPDIAREYLNRNTSNRCVTQSMVNFYAREMQCGRWQFNGDSIRFDSNGNLIDGQHRLLAIIKSGVSLDMLVISGLDSKSFLTIDQGKKRSVGDCFSISGIRQYTLVSGIVRGKMMLEKSRSISSASGGDRNARASSSQLILEEYQAHALEYSNIACFANNAYKAMRIITPAEIGGYYAHLMLTLGWAQEVIEDFLSQITGFTNPTHPTLQLLNKRLICSRTTNAIKITSAYRQQLIIKCWNNFVSGGKPFKTLKWNEETEGKLSFKSNTL